jgi:hypothetical protein
MVIRKHRGPCQPRPSLGSAIAGAPKRRYGDRPHCKVSDGPCNFDGAVGSVKGGGTSGVGTGSMMPSGHGNTERLRERPVTVHTRT